MHNDVTPVTPASTHLEQEKEEQTSDADLQIEEYDKTIADSFPASDPPAY